MPRENNNRGSFGSFATGFLIGGLVGTTMALLNAPQSGEETREQIRAQAQETLGEVRTQVDEAQKRITAQVEDVQARVSSAAEQGIESIRAAREGLNVERA